MSDMQAELAPVAGRERVEVMDVLRGFALLGILLMNIEAFVGPVMESITGVNARFSDADRWMDAAIYVLVQGKFITLFSLLFGMGFAVMLERANATGASGTALYARRLLALLGIGLVHALLIWSGDILLTYALLGFVLLLFFRRTPVSRLPKWGVALYALPLLLTFAMAGFSMLAQQDPQAAAEFQEGMAAQAQQMAALVDGERQAFGSALVEKPVIRHKLMDMRMRIESTRAWLDAVTALADAGKLESDPDCVAQVCLLKNHATQAMQFCADQAVQILGGMGFMRGTKSERIYREVKVMTIGGGAEEIMKELAARQFGL